MIDPPIAVTDDENYIRPIMAAMGFPEEVFAPPTTGNRIVACFQIPTMDEVPARYCCFVAEHFHTKPEDNGYLLVSLSKTHFTPEGAAEFINKFLAETSGLHDCNLPPAPPAHIIGRN